MEDGLVRVVAEDHVLEAHIPCRSAASAHAFAGAMMPAMGNISHINYALTCCVGALLSIAMGLDLGALLVSSARRGCGCQSSAGAGAASGRTGPGGWRG